MRIRHVVPFIALVALLAFVGAGCSSSSSSTNSSTNTASATTSSDAVSIQNFAYNPTDLTVAVGTTVTWTNNDSVSHTVIGDNGGPDSGTIAPGGTYHYTFTTAGTYSYHCAIHPSMTGSVTVTQ